jgi:protein-S-isoprenylcysteine O-methyltransferase Ste14
MAAPSIDGSAGKLSLRTIIKFAAALFMTGVVLFIPAGSIRYWNAWLFLAAIFIPMIAVLNYLVREAPELLEKRMKTREKVKEQSMLVNLSFVFMTFAVIIPGLDYRYQWSHVPIWLIIIAVIIFELGLFMYLAVLKQNSYASRIIEIQENQKVIEDGLYAIVRHPMYAAICLTDLAMPLILGSYYALIPIVFCLLVIIARIKNEEEILKKGLAGYPKYMEKVKYRLLPFIW